MPVSTLLFIVETDACGLGVGSVLIQEGHHIAFISKGKSGKHLILLMYDKKLLALAVVVTNGINI